MSSFSIAPAPTEEKLRGGYYTPAPIAAFLADWVSGAGDRLLEPSCGDGAILCELSQRSRASVGIELNGVEARKARRRAEGAEVLNQDFFDWFSNDHRQSWDGVAGNPPFIRFQHWTDPSREVAFDLMRAAGMKPTRLTNAWVPFVVASVLAVRPGGRVGLVVPAELMQVNYAAQLRAFLIDEFTDLTAVTFKQLVFEGVLQEVVLLLGTKGTGPAAVRVVEVDDAANLPTPQALIELPHAPALRHESEKWTKYLLEPEGINALRRVRARDGLLRLGELADVDVGVVTGRNQFFVLKPSGAQDTGLGDLLSPLVSKSAHLKGVSFAEADLSRLAESDAPCHLLALDPATEPRDNPHLMSYIEAGELAGVHRGYKCSIRKQWWVVPSVWTPDAFLLRQIYDHPRIIANETGATSTDTIHRVRMLNGTPSWKLAAASVNTMTFAFAEVMGRSYGGGVLELEPREAEHLPFPDPNAVTRKDARAVDRMLRSGHLLEALDYNDQRLLPDFDRDLVTDLRVVWERLRDRRLRRGKKTPS